MKKLTALLFVLLTGCVTQPKPFVIGPVIQPPAGCLELRKTHPEAC